MSKLLYLPTSRQEKAIALWIEEFEAHYFSCRARCPKTETTWKGDYLKVFKVLPQHSALTPDLLVNAVINTLPDTRTRKRYCIALGALAKFAGLAVELKPFSGAYSAKHAKARDLPDNRLIAAWYNRIPDARWQWAYGMLATYGLRPHELFHLDCDRLRSTGRAAVKDGKTGARLVFPYFPEWLDSWDLRAVRMPQVSGRCNTDLGSRVTHAFTRFSVPFPAYALRHAWAIRTLEFGVELSLAAQQMGHSVSVHSDLYHRWISEHQQEKAFELVMSKADRPRMP
jgi:integrase